MPPSKPRLAGCELYFEDLEAAKRFYRDQLGLELAEEEPGHHVRLDSGNFFLCLERKGVETYASRDKAVVFLEVADVAAAVTKIGRRRFAHVEILANGRIGWAVLHDPAGHNVLLLEARTRKSKRAAK